MMKKSSGIGRAARASASATAILASAGLLACAAAQARTANGTDTAHLHLVHQRESLLYEEGFAAGALPGRMRAWVTVGSTIAGNCTIYTAHGSIAGRGTATPHGFGRYQSFSGTFSVTGGSGRYRHAHGRTNLYGTFDRRTFALVVQTTGRLSY
jgi:hypothetical protein